ncbi:hypothetical protein CMV_013818 [Castanea mollissima]|uniref:Uncharacterized protein n=1 Tax=Castanea mollissima TaxID=60419 RepID=A0A8J4QZ06_9ROSI|nr:hypothetical protein CMV_013818 [Castanea mollissima]
MLVPNIFILLSKPKDPNPLNKTQENINKKLLLLTLFIIALITQQPQTKRERQSERQRELTASYAESIRGEMRAISERTHC